MVWRLNTVAWTLDKAVIKDILLAPITRHKNILLQHEHTERLESEISVFFCIDNLLEQVDTDLYDQKTSLDQ